MKKNIRGDFRFNKVGQGAFYSGKIQAKNNDNFFFVYDCGTKSGTNFITSEIENFKSDLIFHNNNVLDLLVISHLDNDHVSHLSDLLDGLNRCEKVVLPYLFPVDRLLLFLKQKGIENEEDYRTFLIDPSDFLLARNVDEIIFLDRGKNPENPEVTPDSPPPKPEGDEKINVTVSLELKSTEDLEGEQTILMKNEKIKFCNDNGKIYWGAFWEFYFCCKPQSNQEQKVLDFLRELSKLFPGKNFEARFDKEDLIMVLNANGKMTKIRKLFKKVFGETNNSSIIMLHSPIGCENIELKYKARKDNVGGFPFWNNCSHRLMLSNYCGSLLNGDISLNPYPNVYPQYIQEHLRSVEVFQVPHHGSRRSWNRAVVTDLSRFYPTIMVVNFGWGNSHGHPGEAVLRDIKAASCVLKLNNQFKKFEYTIKTFV